MKFHLSLLLLISAAVSAQDTLNFQLKPTEQTIVFENVHDKVIQFSGLLESRSTGKNTKYRSHTDAKNWPRNRSHILVENCSNLTLTGIRISGPNKNGGVGDAAYNAHLEAQHGIQIEKSQRIRIIDAEISHVYGDLIYLRGSSDIEITQVTGHHNGRQGLAVVDSKKIYFHKNHFYKIRRAHIDLENNHDKQVIENVYIYNNRFGPSRLKWVASACLGTVSYIYIMNNQLYAKDFDIYAGREDGRSNHSNWFIMNNVAQSPRGNPQHVITKFFNCKNIYMSGNIVKGQEKRRMNIMGVRGGENFHLGENQVANGMNKVVEF